MSPAVPPPRRTVVLRANRDTLVLLASAAALTMAIGYAAKTHPSSGAGPRDPVSSAPVVADGWTGQLALLEPKDTDTAAPPREPLSSAALTVPTASMALPTAPKAASTAAPRPRPCDTVAVPAAPCPAAGSASGRIASPAPSKRPAGLARPVPREAGLFERLNPLDHLPDVVKRPFASAGDAIAGWVKRF